MQSGLNSNPKKIKQNAIYDLEKNYYTKNCIYDFLFINFYIYIFTLYFINICVFKCK